MSEDVDNNNERSSFLKSLTDYKNVSDKEDDAKYPPNKKDVLEVFSTNSINRYVKPEDYIKYFESKLPLESEGNEYIPVTQEQIEVALKNHMLITKFTLLNENEKNPSFEINKRESDNTQELEL